jgi:sugar (pentulose or hexulose) kinase
MRFNSEVAEGYGIPIRNVVATGGGANSVRWLQLKADIQGIPVKTLRSSEGGLCGCAMLQATAMGQAESLYDARDIFVQYIDEFLPENHDGYAEQYDKYKKIYKIVKELY